MSESEQPKRGILYVITCAARSTEPMYIQDLVKLAQEDPEAFKRVMSEKQTAAKAQWTGARR